jgi:tRNA(Ile)-lysidine synthase
VPAANEVLDLTDAPAARLTAADFAQRMARLGPFPPAPLLAVGVSGGADSLCLALLASAWARARGGAVRALIVDHGLRPAAADEARLTAALLAAQGIDSRILTIAGLRPGPGQAARARAARLDVLAQACAAAGITDLLLAHHAADQAETLVMRRLSGSGADGIAGIAALRHTAGLRILRPLLDVPPALLRMELRARDVRWVEDPSNADPAALRARLRGASGEGIPLAAIEPLAAAARLAATGRAAREAATADWLAAHAVIRPEGFALIPAAPLPAPALSALIQMVAGRSYPPVGAGVRALAAAPRAATLGGARLLPAGRRGSGWLIVRELASVAPRCPAVAGARWDGRFRLPDPPPSAGLWIGALGAAAARLRRQTGLPGAVLAGLPALWRDEVLAAVPDLMYRPGMDVAAARLLFDPPRPAACGPFVGA